MTKKTRLLFELDEDKGQRFRALAKAHGSNASALLRDAVDAYLGELSEQKDVEAAVRREAKVTVRLPADALAELDGQAREMRVPTSTWAAKVLTAKARGTPQPLKPQKRMVRAALIQLRGMATNVNQMARLMNKAVYSGSDYAPSRAELHQVAKGVADARTDLAAFAAGLFSLQTVELTDE